jgi:4-amino-4-deoxy-L-arabinose transferase-like glycosyltransferase
MGLLVAFLLAIFPLNVISSTRILSDVPLAFFTSLAILFFCYADKKERNYFYFLAGVSLGLGYLAKITEVVVLGIFLLFCLFKVLKNRVYIKNILFLLGGFLLVFFLEGCFYYYTVGKPFMNYYIHHSACMFKYISEFVVSFTVGPINVMYTNGTPIYHLKNVFNVNSGDVSFFGYFYFLFSISIIYSLCKRKNYFLIFFSLLMFLFFEFGFVGTKFDLSEGKLDYFMIFKQQRFLTLITVPLMVVSAYFLLELSKKSKLLVLIGVLFLLVTSGVSINKTHAFYLSGLEDLRAITPLVQEKKDTIFFGDLWAVHHIKIFSKYKAKNLKVINKNAKESDLCNSFIIMGGSRGVALAPDYVLSSLPGFVWSVLASGENPRNWTLIEEREGKSSSFRHYNLKIYYVACF